MPRTGFVSPSVIVLYVQSSALTLNATSSPSVNFLLSPSLELTGACKIPIFVGVERFDVPRLFNVRSRQSYPWMNLNPNNSISVHNSPKIEAHNGRFRSAMASLEDPEKGPNQAASESAEIDENRPEDNDVDESADVEEPITEKEPEEEDPNIVWWNGPNDLEVRKNRL